VKHVRMGVQNMPPITIIGHASLTMLYPILS